MRVSGLAVFLGLALAGCASNVPQAVREAPPDNPSLTAVRADPEAFMAREVRWGGSIVKTTNRPDETCIELVERRLQDSGRPANTDQSGGRFLACTNGFLDPLIYTADRSLTLRGTLRAVESGEVGDFPYRYPVVQMRSHHLWQPEPPPTAYPAPDPFWYSPWGPAWGPYYGHPWYGYPYRWRY